MSRAAALAGLAGWSAVVAMLALAFLHGELRPGQASLCAAFGWAAAVGLAPTWAELPRFVTGWLAAGVATVAVFLGVAATALGNGIPYVVLRGPELGATLVAAGLLGSLVAVLGYSHQRLAREVAAQAVRVAQLRERAVESHLKALTAQVNPHFLFNTLNTLAELVHEDADTAEAHVTDLAHMMRYALRSTSRWVTLGEELDVVRRFLRLEATRLEDRLSWSVDLDVDAAGIEVPGMIVQPLVENAVRHGVASRAQGGRVRVRASRLEERLRIVVEDDGPGVPTEVATAVHAGGRGTEGAGGGLYTVAERVRLAWVENAASLALGPAEDGRGTRIVLDLPSGGPP